jgi:hypothetical protein
MPENLTDRLPEFVSAHLNFHEEYAIVACPKYQIDVPDLSPSRYLNVAPLKDEKRFQNTRILEDLGDEEFVSLALHAATGPVRPGLAREHGFQELERFDVFFADSAGEYLRERVAVVYEERLRRQP